MQVHSNFYMKLNYLKRKLYDDGVPGNISALLALCSESVNNGIW